MTQVPQMKEVHHNLEKCGTKEKILETEVLRKNNAEVKDLSDENPMRTKRLSNTKDSAPLHTYIMCNTHRIEHQL